MCPHPGGPASDPPVLRGQYGVSCPHPGANRTAGRCGRHMALVLSVAWDFPVDFSQPQIFQTSCSFPFLSSKLALAIMFHQLTRECNI